MGIGAKGWRELAVGAVEVLGESWVLAGRGGSTRIVRAPVGWRLQFVGYEDTRLGRLIGYNACLCLPPKASQSGDSPNAISDHYVMPGESYHRRFEEIASPAGVAEWATAVADNVFDTAGTLGEELARIEEVRTRREAANMEPLSGTSSLRRLVALRVVCGTRSQRELVADIDDVLADPRLETYPPLASTRKEPRTYGEFFGRLREAVADGDRGVVESVIDEARRDSLRLLGVPDSAVADVVFPQPEVAW